MSSTRTYNKSISKRAQNDIQDIVDFDFVRNNWKVLPREMREKILCESLDEINLGLIEDMLGKNMVSNCQRYRDVKNLQNEIKPNYLDLEVLAKYRTNNDVYSFGEYLQKS